MRQNGFAAAAVPGPRWRSLQRPYKAVFEGERANWFKFSPKVLRICCHEMGSESRKCIKMRLRPGLRPGLRTPLGELTTLPQTP